MAILRRALLLAAAIEIPLAGLLELWGIPSPFSQDRIGELIVATHAPGIAVLETLGLCCGYVSSLVISDVWTGPVQRPNPVGLVFLAGSNILVLTGVVFLCLLGYRAVKRRVDAAAA